MPSSPARSGGKTWSAGPYVRVGEREAWNDTYDLVAGELKELRRYSGGPDLTDDHIDTAAWNIAYSAIWIER